MRWWHLFKLGRILVAHADRVVGFYDSLEVYLQTGDDTKPYCLELSYGKAQLLRHTMKPLVKIARKALR